MSDPVSVREADFLADPRVQFLRQRSLLALEIPAEAFDAYFKDSLERARSAGEAREGVSKFLSSEYSAGASIFFSSTRYQEDVEIEEDQEIEVEDEEEKKQEQQNVDPNAEGGGGGGEDGAAPVTPAAPAAEGEDPVSPIDGDEDAAPPPATKKMIKKIIKVKKLTKVDKCTLLMGLEKVGTSFIPIDLTFYYDIFSCFRSFFHSLSIHSSIHYTPLTYYINYFAFHVI